MARGFIPAGCTAAPIRPAAQPIASKLAPTVVLCCSQNMCSLKIPVWERACSGRRSDDEASSVTLALYLRNNRNPLNTTSKLTPISANTAIHMVASPAKVMPRKIALITSARTMFCFRMLDVCRDR